MDRGRRLAIAGLLVALAVLAGCSGPADRDEVVCDGCVDGVSAVAEQTNRSVTVRESTTHVYLNRSGDPWVEGRVSLDGSGAEAFRENETLLDMVAAELTNADGALPEDGYSRPAFDRRGVSVGMEGRTLVVGYRVPELTERSVGGTVFSDRLYRQNGGGRDGEVDHDEPLGFETDRLVVHPPAGTDPLVIPTHATRRGDRLVWDSDPVSPRTYLVFGSPGTPGALATVATTVSVLRWAGSTAATGTALAWLVFVPALVACRNYTERIERVEEWSPKNDRRLRWTLLSPLALGGGVILLIGVRGVLGFVLVPGVALAALIYASQRSLVSNDHEEIQPERDDAESATDEPIGPTEDDGPPEMYYEDTATTIRRITPDVVSTRGVRESIRVVGVAVLIATLGSLLVATDYRGVYAGAVTKLSMLVPLAAFAALGYGVADRSRRTVRRAATAAVLGCAWITAFARVVAVGSHGTGGIWSVFGWAVGAFYLGSVVFYVGLLRATR